MRLNVVLNLYKFKVKSFFGAFRISKANIALLLVYVFGLLPSAFGFSIIIVNTVTQAIFNIETYIEFLAAILSFPIIFASLLAMRGYIVFEHEQNFIFTSYIKPIEFLIASILADLTTILVFIYPIFIIYVLVVLWLNLSVNLALLIFAAILLFILLLFFLKVSLSIIVALHRSLPIKLAVSSIIFLLLFPTLGLIVILPIKYSFLPYPSTFMAKVLLEALFLREVQPLNFLSLLLYFLLLTALFIAISKKNFFPMVTCIPFMSPFDTSIRTQMVKMEKSIKVFSRIGMFLTLNPESKSLLAFLIKKEFIRMIREGSLFMIMFIYLVYLTIPFIATAGNTSSLQSTQSQQHFFLLFFIGSSSLIVPTMLVANWRVSDFENLWIAITSGAKMHVIVRAILYVFTLVSSSVPAIIILILSAIYGASPIMVLMALTLVISTSMVGCSVNLYVTIRLLKGIHKTTSALAGLFSMILSAIFLAPIYVLIILSQYFMVSESISVLFVLIALLYSALIMRIFSRGIEKNISAQIK